MVCDSFEAKPSNKFQNIAIGTKPWSICAHLLSAYSLVKESHTNLTSMNLAATKFHYSYAISRWYTKNFDTKLSASMKSLQDTMPWEQEILSTRLKPFTATQAIWHQNKALRPEDAKHVIGNFERTKAREANNLNLMVTTQTPAMRTMPTEQEMLSTRLKRLAATQTLGIRTKPSDKKMPSAELKWTCGQAHVPCRRRAHFQAHWSRTKEGHH